MAKKTKTQQNSIKKAKENSLSSIKQIVSKVENEKRLLIERKKQLDEFEKELNEREKMIEQEIENFTEEVNKFNQNSDKLISSFKF